MILSPVEWEIVLLSLKVSGTAMAAILPVAFGLAWILARKRFAGKVVLDALIHLPLVLPPVVTGWLLLILFGIQAEQPITKLRRAYDALVAENLALARALGGVAAAVKGYRWIPAGEWGPFPAGKRTARTLRREASECFAEVLRIVDEALRASAARLDAEAQGGRRG